MKKIKRGDIYYADLSPVVGSEQGGNRPVVVIQNDIGNLHSSTVIVALVTSKNKKSAFPTHVHVDSEKSCFAKDSTILLEQVRTIDKNRLKNQIGSLQETQMEKINQAICVSFGIIPANAMANIAC